MGAYMVSLTSGGTIGWGLLQELLSALIKPTPCYLQGVIFPGSLPSLSAAGAWRGCLTHGEALPLYCLIPCITQPLRPGLMPSMLFSPSKHALACAVRGA